MRDEFLDLYLIWSNEHGSWWRDGSLGYTRDLKLAGVYDRSDALQRCVSAFQHNGNKSIPNELPVRIGDLPAGARAVVYGHRRKPSISEEILEFIQGVELIVEANNFEKTILWERNHERVAWEEKSGGYLTSVGTNESNQLIYVSVLVHSVNGKKVLFWHPTGEVVDHQVINRWFQEYLPGVQKTDAQNFHP